MASLKYLYKFQTVQIIQEAYCKELAIRDLERTNFADNMTLMALMCNKYTELGGIEHGPPSVMLTIRANGYNQIAARSSQR